ncbi:MAG: hypothetical protein WBB22_15580 [Anaerolineae bacterium]
MNSRERVQLALDHQETDRIPLDAGATPVTGVHVQSVYKLRQALGLDPPGTPVKIIERFQSLGEIKPDLIDALGVDVITAAPVRQAVLATDLLLGRDEFAMRYIKDYRKKYRRKKRKRA